MQVLWGIMSKGSGNNKRSIKDLPVLVKVIGVYLVLLIGIAAMTNLLFYFPAVHPVFEAQYEAGSFLEFASSLLVGLGTLALSHAVYKREIRDRGEDRYDIQRPFLILENLSVSDGVIEKDWKGRCVAERVESKEVGIKLKNIGNGPACGVRWREDVAFGVAPVLERTQVYLGCGEECSFSLDVSQLEKKGSMEIPLSYSNVVGCGYSQSLTACAQRVVEACEPVEDEDGVCVDAVTDASLCVTVTSLSKQRKA